MRTPQGSEHTTCAKVVEGRAVRLTGAVSIDRRKAGLRRRIEAVSDPAVFGHAFRNTKFGIGTAKRSAVVPLPRRLKAAERQWLAEAQREHHVSRDHSSAAR